MSNILSRDKADKTVFSFKPKSFKVETSKVAKDFVKQQEEKSSGFQISEIVAKQSGISEIKQREIEAQIEKTVLDRIKEIEEEAYKKGHELGLIEGSEKAFQEKKSQLEEHIQKFDSLFIELEKAKKAILQQNESYFVKVIFQVAEKIAMRSLQEEQEPIIEMLNQLVEGVHGDDSIVIHMSSKDYKFIEELKKKSNKDINFLEKVKLAPNEDIQDGGCLIETSFGSIDATVPERVTRVWKSLESKLPNLRGQKVDLTSTEEE